MPLPLNAKELINHFIHMIIIKRFNLNIKDNELNRIINIDENVVYYESPNTKIVEFNDNKEIIINPEGNGNKRISVLLSICGDGSKLPPFCIFQDENKKGIEYILQNNVLVRNKSLFAITQNKPWCDTDIFLEWYEKIFLFYEKVIIRKKCLLILDKSPSHFNKDIIDKFNENETCYVFIPGGLSRYLQPLDICVNEPFKDALIREYLLYKKMYKNNNLNFYKSPQESREDIIRIINHIWWESEDISSKEIKDGFHKGGITLKDDRSEDDKWEFPTKIIDNYSIYDDFENKIVVDD